MEEAYLTTKQAYLATYEFLVRLYERTESDAVGSLLGDMSFLVDGQTADPAAWTDWLACVKKVLNDPPSARLELRKDL
jgi:hypothetical protein